MVAHFHIPPGPQCTPLDPLPSVSHLKHHRLRKQLGQIRLNEDVTAETQILKGAGRFDLIWVRHSEGNGARPQACPVFGGVYI